MKYLSITLTLIVLFATNLHMHAYAKQITGKVVKIADGDTITVLQDNKQHKIRLYGIDTPEKRQDFGQAAKQFLSQKIYNKKVQVEITGEDRYSRKIGIVYLGNDLINEKMVQGGYAWVYQKYCQKAFCKNWIDYQGMAQKEQLGLWSGSNPIPPWEYRHSKKGKSSKAMDMAMATSTLFVFHGNVKSRIFHSQSCKHFNCKNCTKIFSNRDAAIQAKFKPCGRCNP